MNRIYYLSTCDTCARIIDELGLRSRRDFEFQDIKTQPLTASQLAEMKKKAGSYEALFSRIALKYKKLDPKPSTEAEYKKLILQEYTFLKRPVILYNDELFIGNGKNNIRAAAEALAGGR